ncbi:MAG TPA: polyprenol phosphomannose-dependent alpha 1,6 mannosyltransferase MptB [Mycobacteriales bacterium]|nr:polyprenol phosphomannose-dependent alpha 1,6 mannosyltransferase MptB [Mycobacteriales bacterium]
MLLAPTGAATGTPAGASGAIQLRAIRRGGLAGSLLLLLGSLGAGALPVYDPVRQWPGLSVLRLGVGPTVALALAYVGAAILGLAWLYLGRAVRAAIAGTGPDVDVPVLFRLGLTWGAPMLVAVPLFSRDLYSYAAQAQLTHAGLDPYSAGPVSLPGPFADEVEHLWVDTPAPYGPLWLTLGRLVAIITRDHVALTVLCMRLIAVGGVLLTARYLPRLATACGADPRLAVWLSLLNPLLLTHFVAGGHNDALMVGLVVAGVTIAIEVTRSTPYGARKLALGAVLCTLAVLVKAPAVLAVGFLVPIWAVRTDDRRPWLAAVVKVGAVAVATFVLATLATGLGIGWVRLLNTPGLLVNFLSIPTGVALLVNTLRGIAQATSPQDPLIGALRLVGQACTVLLCCYLWVRAQRVQPVRALGLALLLLVMLGPVVQPWYLMWPLALLAATRLADWAVAGIACVSLMLVLLIAPQGAALLLNWTPVVMSALAAVVATYLVLGDHLTLRVPALAAPAQPVVAPAQLAVAPAQPDPAALAQQDQREAEEQVLNGRPGQPRAEDRLLVIGHHLPVGQDAVGQKLEDQHDGVRQPEHPAQHQPGPQ